MGDDRSLIEDAARAAGMRYEWTTPPRPLRLLTWDEAEQAFVAWNPLVSDGDRYWLARTLRMRIDFALGRVLTMDGKLYDWWAPGDKEAEARAITTAAAEAWRARNG